MSLSSVVLAAGFLLFFVDAFRSARLGPLAGDNPWHAPTLEWATVSPPPAYNFALIPAVGSGYPLCDEPDILPVATGLRIERRELIVSTVANARPEAREASPASSIWPFWTAIATAITLISSIFGPWADAECGASLKPENLVSLLATLCTLAAAVVSWRARDGNFAAPRHASEFPSAG